MEYLPAWMFLALTILLMAGFPVTFTLMGTALCFGLIGFGWDFFNLLPLRIWGVMTNVTLLAVPLFVFMGVMLERSGLAEELLDTMGLLFGRMKGGLAISVVVVGALLGASTGIVGATVVTMGLMAVPTMLKRGYQKAGTVAASGTLGQIIPPSVILVLLGDIVGVPVGDLFMGAVMPGMLLVGLYIIWIIIATFIWPDCAPPIPQAELDALTPTVQKGDQSSFSSSVSDGSGTRIYFYRCGFAYRSGRCGRGRLDHTDRRQPKIQHADTSRCHVLDHATDLYGFYYPRGSSSFRSGISRHGRRRVSQRISHRDCPYARQMVCSDHCDGAYLCHRIFP